MFDSYGRRIDYLRVSVTDRCNLRCIYCMPKDGIKLIPHDEILTFEEMLRVIKAATKLGISKIRITGGEPLARLGVIEFVKKIKEIPEINEVSMTTNGLLLKDNMDALVDAGLDRVNISLDTLDEEKYFKMTRVGSLSKVMEGINLALAKGLKPLKINIVIINEYNFSEIMDFVRLQEELPVEVRFIELMPIGEGKNLTSVSSEDIKNVIKLERKLMPCTKSKGSGPAKYFKTNLSKGSIGFISPLSHEFCGSCNRVRLTSEGFLKLCLHWNKGIDLKNLLRNGLSDEELVKVIAKNIKEKPVKHEMKKGNTSDQRGMSQIGG